MKKIICTLAVIFTALGSMRADEGMWLLPLLQKMNAGDIQSLGCRLTPEQIYSINHASLKDAIVQFGGGCTGEIISNEGLLVTNHHCGYGSIQKLSTPEHNYLEDGYWAMKRSEELPVPGLTVKFLQSMTDVTAPLQKVYDAALKQHKNSPDCAELAQKARTAAEKQMIEQAEKENPHCTARITRFYNNNVSYLIVYKIYNDIRFVGAPPASSGKFGGETDNWMWPRHTCDFSMFRVYAGRDNEPAEYSEENIPLTPKQSLKISLRGVNEGDYAMIMGYPGRTQRFQTVPELESMIALHRISIDARTVRQRVMKEGMQADPVVRLKYSSIYASSSNGWKKWQGEELAFEKLDIIGRERSKEEAFTSWVEKSKKRRAAYGSALADIEAAVNEQRAVSEQVTLVNETLLRIAMLKAVMEFVPQLKQISQMTGKDSLAARQEAMDALMSYYKDYDEALERRMAAAMLDHYRANAASGYALNIPDYQTLDAQKYIDEIFDGSLFANAEKAAALADMKMEQVAQDPAVGFFVNIADIMMKAYGSYDQNAVQARHKAGSKAFAAGLMEWKKGEKSYPDANSTMRITYGSVKPYSPKDAVTYKHFTTLKGVMEKEDPDNYEFRVPARLKEIYQNGDYGRYADKDGTLHTCFLTNNDITGGNSGSPVLDADGNLIGLAFDGNWESMSSDVMFEPELQRCICVDIRFVLLMMDKFGGAGYLLNEMKIVE